MDDGKLSRWPMVAITVMRVAVGWHFLYEGIAKLTAASWSASGYLKQARGPFAWFFKWLACGAYPISARDIATYHCPSFVAVAPPRSGQRVIAIVAERRR